MDAEPRLSDLTETIIHESSIWLSFGDCCESCQSPPLAILSTKPTKSLQEFPNTIKALEEELKATQNRVEQLEWTKVDLESSITFLTLSHARLQRMYSESLNKNAELVEELQKFL